MSVTNPWLGDIGLKVIPDENRRSGEIISYKLSPEEMEQRYGKPSDERKGIAYTMRNFVRRSKANEG